MSILIIGATGQVGQQTVLSLLDHGARHVKLLVRSEEKARDLFKNHESSAALQYFTGDYKTNLNEQAFENLERVFFVNHEPQYDVSIVKKALEKNGSALKQVVKLSAYGASLDNDFGGFLRGHTESEHAIYELAKQHGFAFVFLRPTMFCQNYITFDVQSIKHTGKIYRQGLPDKIDFSLTFIDTRDIGEAAAVTLTQPIEKTRDRTYVLTGPDVLAPQQVADLFTNILGKPIENVPLDDPSYYRLLIEVGTPEQYAFGMVKLYQLIKSHQMIAVGDYQILTGKAPRSFSQFIEDHKDHFL